MIRAIVFLSCGVLQADALSWAERCQVDRERCTTYCIDYPQYCTPICAADPTIPGCPPTIAPPKPKCPENCCQDETPECKACHACQDPSEWCANNLKFPGCTTYCCEHGCSDTCRMKPNGSIDVERKCKWRVQDQSHTAFRPVLLEANVEASCPFALNYGLHLETCRHCAAQHAPCEDTYMACGGCCGTPWHDLMDLAINTHHTCDEIKGYFKIKNYVKVECEEATDDNKDTDGNFEIQPMEPNTSKVVDEGTLKTNCSTDVKKLDCNQIPVKMRFECDDCANKGAPDLLDQCCDKCVAWAAKAERGEIPGIPSNIKPFIFCSGCNVTHVEPLDPLFAANKLYWFPWEGASRYTSYTEEAADAGIETFIEDKVCSLLSPTCSTGTTSSPGFLSSTTSPQRPCLTGEGGTCAAWDDPTLLSEEGSDDGGRRLAERRLIEMRGKNVVCANMDFNKYETAKDVHPNATKLLPAESTAFEERKTAVKSQTAVPVEEQHDEDKSEEKTINVETPQGTEASSLTVSARASYLVVMTLLALMIQTMP